MTRRQKTLLLFYAILALGALGLVFELFAIQL
jgi:hypothetical protein